MHAYVLLGCLLQPSEVHDDVGESNKSSNINKDVFFQMIRALFNKKFKRANEECVPLVPLLIFTTTD